jgi:hypothetical protein
VGLCLFPVPVRLRNSFYLDHGLLAEKRFSYKAPKSRPVRGALIRPPNNVSQDLRWYLEISRIH